MEAECSAEMEETPSLEALFSEHNYFKTQAAADDVEPMETAESAATSLDPPTSAGQSLSLTQLDTSKDTFETCLIQLLHAYTTNRRGGGASNSPPSTASTPQSEGGASGGGGGVSKGGGGGGQGTPPPAAPFIDISPESLTSLSPEQVSVLVTSNSVNYEVIQQIMAQKQGYQGIPMKAASLVPGSGNNEGQLDPDTASNNNGSSNSGQSSRQQTPDGASPSATAAAAGGVVSKGGSEDSTPPVGSPSGVPSQQILKNPIQISPEHLQVLQQQVSDLLRSKQISLPADMTAQQQQALIHSILLKQLKEKQLATSISGVASSLPQPQPSSSVASTSGSSSSAPPGVGSARRATGGRVTAAVVKKDPSSSAASLTLGNLLSSSDNMSGQSIAAMKAKEEKKEKNSTSVTPAAPLSTTPTPPSLPDTTKPPSSLPTPPPPASSSAAAPTPTVPAPSSTPSSSSAAVKQPPSRTEPSASTKTTTTTTAAATNPKAAAASSVPAAPAKSSSNTSPPSTRASAGKSGGGGRGKKKGDSNKNEPKKPPMPYNIFFSEVYSTVMAANTKMTFADASKIISMMWNAMGSDVKQKYHERHEELKEEYQANLKKFKEQEQQQQQLQREEKEKEREGGGEEAHQPIKTDDAPATSPENKEGNLLQCAESAVESGDLEDEAMEITQHEVKDPSLCVNHGCSNKAVFEKDRGPQYCSNECVVMDTRNVFASWIRNRKVRE